MNILRYFRRFRGWHSARALAQGAGSVFRLRPTPMESPLDELSWLLDQTDEDAIASDIDVIAGDAQHGMDAFTGRKGIVE